MSCVNDERSQPDDDSLKDLESQSDVDSVKDAEVFRENAVSDPLGPSETQAGLQRSNSCKVNQSQQHHVQTRKASDSNSSDDAKSVDTSKSEEESTASGAVTPMVDQQSNVLPHKRLMIVYPVLALCQFTAYLDQTSISSAVPTIGSALNVGSNQLWISTSYLLATTAVQLVNGRLSDIFGRKRSLITALTILMIGNVCGGFSQNQAMLFAFRTISGLGGGSIQALVMIIASDITTLQQRGKYNGFTGAAVAVGSGIGPLLGGAIAANVSWRWTLWYDTPWIAMLILLLYITLPEAPSQGGTRQKLKMIDWAGLFLSIAAITFLVVPLSSGGTLISWTSPEAITLLVLGVVALLVFLVVEGKFVSLPIMPLRLFTTDLSCQILLFQNLLYGFVFWGNLFYMPLYLENVRGYSSTIAGAIIIPMVGCQGIGSIISGQIISRTGHYNIVMRVSQWMWFAGQTAQAFYSRSTPIWAICLVGIFQGLGTGGCFQPSLVALLAHSRRADRAVLNSLRNFLRTMGGTFSLTVSGTILNTVLKQGLKGVVAPRIASELATSTSSIDTLGLSADQQSTVLSTYMKGIHVIFIVYAPIIGICALGAMIVRDSGLAEKDTSTTLHVKGKLGTGPAEKEEQPSEQQTPSKC